MTEHILFKGEFRELNFVEIDAVSGGLLAEATVTEASGGPIQWPPPGYHITSTYLSGNDPLNSPDLFFPSSFGGNDSSGYTATLTNSNGTTASFQDYTLSALSQQVSAATGSSYNLGDSGYTVQNSDGSVQSSSYFSPDVVITAQSAAGYHSNYLANIPTINVPDLVISNQTVAAQVLQILHTNTSPANAVSYTDTPAGVNMTQLNGEAQYLGSLMESLSKHGTGREYAAVFYTLPGDSSVYFTDPVAGLPGNIEANLPLSAVPNGATVVGEIHSHPYQDGVDGRIPSNASTTAGDATHNDTYAAQTLAQRGCPNIMTYIVSNDGGSSTGVYAYDMQNVGSNRLGQKL